VKASSEPSIDGTSRRPDFSLTYEGKKYYYNIKVVSINATSAELDPNRTLEMAAQAKQLKYKGLGPCFRPLVFSAGGLIEKQASSEYKRLQKSLGRSSSKWLDSIISLILLRTRAISRASLISKINDTH